MDTFEKFEDAKINLFNSFKIDYKENPIFLNSRIYDRLKCNWRTSKEEQREDAVSLELWEQNEQEEAILGSLVKENVSTMFSNATQMMGYDKDMDAFYVIEKSMRGKYNEAE